MPWNYFNITAQYNESNLHVENVFSTFEGVTFPMSGQQVGYHEEALTFTSQGPITTFTVTVQVSVNMFVQGIGQIYSTSYDIRGYIRPCPGGGRFVEYEELQ